MMKLFVLYICALAAVLAQGPVSEVKTFLFEGTDGVSNTQELFIPFDYAGNVNIHIHDSYVDSWLCIHWVVPVVSPGEGEELADIWKETCTNFQAIPAGNTPFDTDVALRSGYFYITATVDTTDVDSDGIVVTDYDFNVTFTYTECEAGFFGSGCAWAYTELPFNTPFSLTLGPDQPQYFTLPTNGVEGADFASSLNFEFQPPVSANQNVDYTLRLRLMGPPDNEDDGSCQATTSLCQIENPPFVFTSNYTWGIQIGANADVTVNLNISFGYCGDGKIGSNCGTYETFPYTELGHLKKYSKKTTFVFNSSVAVAVGGLDGYTQTDVAPAVYVQVDAEPDVEKARYVLVSEMAKTNVVMINLPDPDSKVVLLVDPPKAFGMWLIDGTTQCPNDCEDNGSCDASSYVCVCDPDYEDLDCTHEIKDFTIEYIILIAVGSLLILSIVIGVPIYCFLNRNQEYETVA